jgi:hypothetical protein
MVASSIMVILVLLVVKVANDTLSAYDRVVADLSAQTEARAVLDNLERDLNSAVIRPDGRCWMEIVAPGMPTAGSAPTGVPATAIFPVGMKVPNVPADLQPVIMLFASPTDRPRFRPGMATRDASGNRINEIRGDVCAVSYRMGLRSPFDSPGDLIQQIYCVQRTIIDGENTFKEALTGANAISASVPPSAYWVGSRTVANYTAGGNQTQALIDGTLQGGWTMNEDNFCAQNVVGLGVVLWCASTESKALDLASAGVRAAYTGGLPAEALRPVFMHVGGANTVTQVPTSNTENTYRTPSANSGYGLNAALWGFLTSNSGSTFRTVARADRYESRARIYSDRIFLDNKVVPLPYVLRQVEVSVTVLTPAGARELRALQRVTGSATFAESTTSTFRRIVHQHSRSYSRRIQVLGNGG